MVADHGAGFVQTDVAHTGVGTELVCTRRRCCQNLDVQKLITIVLQHKRESYVWRAVRERRGGSEEDEETKGEREKRREEKRREEKRREEKRREEKRENVAFLDNEINVNLLLAVVAGFDADVDLAFA